MMGEPYYNTTRNMDGIKNTNLDGNLTTTLVGSEDLIVGRDREWKDSIGVGQRKGNKLAILEDSAGILSSSSSSSSSSTSSSSSSSPSLSSSSVSYGSCNWEMALFSYRDKRKGRKVIKRGGVTLEDKGYRKGETVGNNRKRKAMKKEVKRKEIERKEKERKEKERKEKERKEKERKESERKEKERKEKERKEKERKEKERKEKERKEMELERKEVARIMDMSKEMLPLDLGRTIMEEANRILEICTKLEKLEGGSYGEIRKCAGKILEANLHLQACSVRSAFQLREMKKESVCLKEQIKGMSSGLSSSPSSSSPPCKRGDMKAVTETDSVQNTTVDVSTRKESGMLPSSMREEFVSLPPLTPLPQRPSRNLTARSEEDRLSLVVQAPSPVVIGDFEGGETGKEVCKDGSLQDGGEKTEWRPVVGRHRRRECPLPPLLDSGKTNRKETERKEPERKETERKDIDRKEEVRDGQTRDGPGGGDAITITDWANMMYAKRKAMERERRSPTGQRQLGTRLRPPSFSAVAIVGRTDGFSYAAALKSARERIDLETLGIRETKIRKTANGGVLIEILEEDSRRKAEELGTRIRKVLGESARVFCPSGKKREVSVTGFDKSVSVEEIGRVFSSFGGCPSTDVRVGPIRTLKNGLGIVRVQLPAVAAEKLVDIERIRLGWMMARVELSTTELPLQCFRCWRYGHVQNRCHGSVDRRDACYKCGEFGHKVSACQNTAHCVICHDAGLEAVHRLGGPRCGTKVQQQGTSTDGRSIDAEDAWDGCGVRERE